jgi:hypothetical protein
MPWLCVPLSNNVWPLLQLLPTKLWSNLIIQNHTYRSLRHENILASPIHLTGCHYWIYSFSSLTLNAVGPCIYSFYPIFFLQLFIVSRLSKLGVCCVFLAKFCYPTSYPLYQQNVVIFFFLWVWTFSLLRWKTNQRERATKQEVLVCAVMNIIFAAFFTYGKHIDICCPKTEINTTKRVMAFGFCFFFPSPSSFFLSLKIFFNLHSGGWSQIGCTLHVSH